jgi:uncharacterized glyoxalase superfamily protein PhnB
MSNESASAGNGNNSSGHGAASTPPQTFSARELSTSMTVKDVRASQAWYRDVLGFAVDREMEHEGKLRAVAMRAGAVRVLLNQDDGAKGWDRAKGQGISLMFTMAGSVDEVANRIKASGGTLISEPADMPWGARVFRVADPDGFQLVIASERSTPSTG